MMPSLPLLMVVIALTSALTVMVASWFNKKAAKRRERQSQQMTEVYRIAASEIARYDYLRSLEKAS